MRISVLVSDIRHPVYDVMCEWSASRSGVNLVSRVADVGEGDILFLISCGELVSSSVRNRFRKCFVVHASDLPRGRGWSPHIWQVLEGADGFTVTLFEAADAVDSGDIWTQARVTLSGSELFDEINEKLFAATVGLMDAAVDGFETIVPQKQGSGGVSYYAKRTPEDSRLDPFLTIASQFDLLRVCDPNRFPAFFDYRGCRYTVEIRKA